MKNKTAKIEGLHLWLVTSPEYHLNLWITTSRNDSALAIRKAQTWLRRKADVKNPRITNVSNNGTIDA
jgi:hypothetical protein